MMSIINDMLFSQILLEYGASLETKNEEDQTALHLAAQNGRVQ